MGRKKKSGSIMKPECHKPSEDVFTWDQSDVLI